MFNFFYLEISWELLESPSSRQNATFFKYNSHLFDRISKLIKKCPSMASRRVGESRLKEEKKRKWIFDFKYLLFFKIFHRLFKKKKII